MIQLLMLSLKKKGVSNLAGLRKKYHVKTQLNITTEYHKKIKTEADKRDVPMQDIIREAISEYFNKGVKNVSQWN